MEIKEAADEKYKEEKENIMYILEDDSIEFS